ncbi:MAG TPA: class I SAM-dependent methyltransferase, partial [Aquella sp.]|nr:class I SAM-dependent methyltransferase [Aquella sp.]
NSFSLITVFQTLEHVDDPAKLFSQAFDLLKPGGVLMVITHNYRHWLMRLLGRKSPIIDIEHLQLFSPASLRFTYEKNLFTNIKIQNLRNRYPLSYWFKLLPIPIVVKQPILKSMNNGLLSSIGSLPIGMNVGNIVAFGYKSKK